jgi:hypothetical protein
MQHHRTAVVRRSVSGLGVCDALRLELEPVQLPWLADELDEMRGPLEEALARARTEGTEDEAAAHRYELRLLRMMRAQIPDARAAAPMVFVGPTGLVDEAVRGTMRNVVGALAELAHGASAEPGRLRDAAAAADAWVRTFLDLRAVVAFNFDPEAEPSQPW